MRETKPPFLSRVFYLYGLRLMCHLSREVIAAYALSIFSFQTNSTLNKVSYLRYACSHRDSPFIGYTPLPRGCNVETGKSGVVLATDMTSLALRSPSPSHMNKFAFSPRTSPSRWQAWPVFSRTPSEKLTG
jgi:hypothetical protein